MMRTARFALLAVLVAAAPSAAQDGPTTPYWASIASGEAMMRVGPGRTYPGKWLYKRRDLPVKVHKRYDNWRLIEDPDGERGWMIVSLMSADRTAMIEGDEPQPIHERPTSASRVAYLAEPGVIAKLDDCDGRWCRVRIGNRLGYIVQGSLYGVEPGERVE